VAYNVFLSFATEDKPLVELFRGQAKSQNTDLELRDYSIKEPFDYAWKTNCERIIRMCSVTICLVGRSTYKSAAVDWEIRKSAQLGKGILAVYLEDGDVRIPQVLRELNVRPVRWQIDSIMKRLEQVAK
jgi:hypothetical protein